jgi:UDP-glucose 4-epimerase
MICPEGVWLCNALPPIMASWLITGGAGYIGAHVVHAMFEEGHDVIVLDDMSTGVSARVPAGVPIVPTSVQSVDRVRAVLQDYRVDGVIHLAAKKTVEDSINRPLYYYNENVTGFQTLLTAMCDIGIQCLVLSSSAAVYGSPETPFVSETSDTNPINPYGETKLVCEWMVRAVGKVVPLKWVALRYFNVAGAGTPDLGDHEGANLIPLTLQAVTEGRRPQIFGDDYGTRDGTCVRDYIHVVDLAQAHVAAAMRLLQGPCNEVYNVGRGDGVTVKEVMTVIRQVTGFPFECDVIARRPSDAGHVVANTDKIRAHLDWKAELNLIDMVSSAWEAWRRV